MVSKKLMSFIELGIIIFSVISFSYFVSTNVPEVLKNPAESKIIQFLVKPIFPIVSASQYTPSGCCLETLTGAICQEMNLVDSASCKTNLIGTSCSTVSECQSGCCFDQNSGLCSLNAPKQKCESNGGNWSSDTKCNIPECQLGCCVLGDSASMTTSRECTLLSNQYNFQKTFLQLDSQGSCLAYTGLTDEGACLTPTNDFSGKNNCVFTTKSNCAGTFKKGYLCTSQELNTNCDKTKKTSCFSGSDRIFYIDTCGNKANIYDSTKADNQSYWEKIISPQDSCQDQSTSCGNCDYSTGSVCSAYNSAKGDQKPIYGDNVCRNLNCANGKKHGESWCVSDYNTEGTANAPVGSRNYLAKCLDSQISIQPCADFNQEICIQSNDTDYTEAKCVVNDWRTCLLANEKDTYEQIKKECDLNSQCIMFLDIPGNEKYLGLPGFKDSGSNEDQARAGDIGRDTNKVIAHCVPKYTPGLQFWSTSSNPFSLNNQQGSTANYGGGLAETNSICSLGSLTCVSHIVTDTSIAGGSSSKDWQNPECNINAVDFTKQKVSLVMEALNERCRSIGSCGTQTNVQGKLGGTEGFTITRVRINKMGEQKNATIQGYNLTQESLDKIISEQSGVPMGSFKTLSAITSAKGATPLAYFFASLLTGRVTEDIDTTTQQAQGAIGQNAAGYQQQQQLVMGLAGATGALAGIGLIGGGTGAALGTTAYFASGGLQYAATTVGKTTSFQVFNPTTKAWTPVTNTPQTISSSGNSATINIQTNTVQSNYDAALKTGETTNSPAPGTPAANGPTALQQVGINIAVTAATMVVAYYLGQLIIKGSGMTPAEANNFMNTMMAGGALVGQVLSTMIIAGMSQGLTVGTALGAMVGTQFGAAVSGGALTGGIGPMAAILGPIMFWAAVVYLVYTLYQESQDHEYYILQFTCEAWEPPKQGDCSSCNNDVRPCSEYKCRSLGNNCHYFNDNGEPGFCASLSDIWKASIKPWPEVLSPDAQYTDVKDTSFKILGKTTPGTPAYIPVTFGIITDKEAICKIGLNHSASFDTMGTTMVSSVDINTGKLDGMHHQITLSPHVTTLDYQQQLSSITTLPIQAGENDYYIKCRNFAGQENDAAFLVRVNMSQGPDLTPPVILSYIPKDNSYMKLGETNFTFKALINEPAECRYSIKYDYTNYSEMPFNMSCLTDPASGFYGVWPCLANLNNLTEDINQIFVKCLDQPGLIETALIQRVPSSTSSVYTINKCNKPLTVSITSPVQNSVYDGKGSISLDLEAETNGCVNGGEAYCSFLVDSFGTTGVAFFKTGNTTIHHQQIDGLTSGNHSIFVSCVDSAGNTANATTSFSLNFDDNPPVINRIYLSGKDLILNTDELAECIFKYSENNTGDCTFNFDSAKNQTNKVHVLSNAPQGTYYVRCRDAKLNEPLSCTEIISVK